MDQRVQVTMALLEGNLRNTPSLAKLAVSVNLSTSRLRHLFKTETGITPAQYLKSLRLKKASELLATTFLSVKEVMLKVGLNNESHFVHDFNKVYGLTPGRYRAHRRQRPGQSASNDLVNRQANFDIDSQRGQ